MDEIIKRMHNLLIECEMPSDQKARFRKKYELAAGESPDENFMQSQSNKWGIECRMYFDASEKTVTALKKEGFHVETRSGGYGSERAHRINSQKLFWNLIKRGYRLGKN